MSRVARDLYRRKLERHLAHSVDEPIIALVAAFVAILRGDAAPLHLMSDLPPEAVGAQLGSRYHIPPWTLETLVNELLATPKLRRPVMGRTRLLRNDSFVVLRNLTNILNQLENAEDEIFLGKYPIFNEMARIAQRQFPWQRGVANAPHLYRSVLLFGSGSASTYFEATTGISVAHFIKFGAYLGEALRNSDYVDRGRDLSEIGITPEIREAALARFALEHTEARRRAATMRTHGRNTAYRASILRDFPVISFGSGQRLRAPIPELIMYRYTSGLYFDVVQGGPAVWTDIGKRFEQYVLDYFSAMMAPYVVKGETTYGPKKARYRTPDVLISNADGIVAAIECKAKRMSLIARYANDPVVEAGLGFEELAKGIFQLWRFFAHARQGMMNEARITSGCQGIIVTADSWLTMAREQAEQVVAAAHVLADREGDIATEDRRDVAICQIDDVELALQNGNADSFLAACRDISSGEKKGWMLSVPAATEHGQSRPYPFADRIQDLLPWMPPRPRGLVGS